MSFLKPKPATSSSTSENVNNGLITSTYGGQMGQGTGATNFLAQLLGVSPSGVAGAANSIGQSFAFHILRRYVRPTVAMTHFVDGHHIRVAQRGGSTRLALEETQAFGVLLKVWRQQLDGNLPPEFQILG